MAGHNNYFNGLVQIRAQYNASGEDRDVPENVTWWKGAFSTGLSLGQATAIQLAFDTAWAVMWSQVGVDSVAYAGSVLTDWSSNTGIESTSVGTFAPVDGTQTDRAPAQAAALISLQVALRFKGGHGRVYLPAIGNSATTSAMDLTTGVVTLLNEKYLLLANAMNAISSGNGGPFVQQLFRFRSADYPTMPTPVPALVPIVAANAQQLLATQRRRLRKVAHR